MRAEGQRVLASFFSFVVVVVGVAWSSWSCTSHPGVAAVAVVAEVLVVCRLPCRHPGGGGLRWHGRARAAPCPCAHGRGAFLRVVFDQGAGFLSAKQILNDLNHQSY